MKPLNTAVLLVSSGFVLSAAPIYNNVTDANGDFATASANLIVSSDPAGYSELQAQGRTYYSGPSNIQISGSLTLDQALSIAGPNRSGFIQVVLTAAGGHNNGIAYGSVSLPSALNGQSLDTICYSSDNGCIGNNQDSFHHYGLIPFEIGKQFTLSYAENGYAMTDMSGEGGFAEFSLDYSFRFFEADGTTPVPVELVATPEPRTCGLLILGTLLLLLRSTLVRRFRH